MDQKTAATPLRSRRAVGVAGLLLALAAATACGSGASGTTAGSSGSPSAPASAPAASPSASPSNPDPRPSSPPKPSAEPTPAESRPGIAVGEPDPSGRLVGSAYRVDGLRLAVTFYGGICEKYGLKLDESKPGTVLAKVVVTQPQQAGTECVALAKQQEVSADLKTPLGGRTVFDQTTNQELPRSQGPDPVGGPQH
ncbi:hypothetical protein ACIRPK_15955 [Kitasatospora sp. NPDC101801]|uniref:hypothetical protein n=1 Tax=Kitasatospora sp. NPDC101801 TaxID=3364103 RepID=UPI00381B94F4